MKSRAGRGVFWLLVMTGLAGAVFGQSGRSRPPVTAPPKPQPEPRGVVTGPVVLGVPEGGKLVGQESAGGTGRYRLRNGLTTVVRERHSVPLVVVEVAAGVGWAGEAGGMSGLVQELLVGGPANGPASEKNGKAALESEIARLGGRLNARLEARVSSIQVVAPAESYAAVVEILAGVLLEPDLSSEGLAVGDGGSSCVNGRSEPGSDWAKRRGCGGERIG